MFVLSFSATSDNYRHCLSQQPYWVHRGMRCVSLIFLVSGLSATRLTSLQKIKRYIRFPVILGHAKLIFEPPRLIFRCNVE